MATNTVMFWFWKRFPKWAWMLFAWILLQCPHFTVKLSPYPSGFGCIIYCLARENGQWVIKTSQPHSWIKLAALQANSCIRMHKLSNFNRRKIKHLNQVSCVFILVVFCWKHGGRFPEWAWMPFTWIPSQCPHFSGESQLIKMANGGSSSVKGQAPPTSDI